MNEKVTTEGKRPATATPEEAIRRSKAGETYEEIGKDWGISRQRVGQLIKDFQDKKNAEPIP